MPKSRRMESPLSCTKEMPERSKLFISYCHEDIRWLKAVRQQLAVFEREGLLDVFEDTRLGAGDLWFDRLHSEMSQARVGLLLLSAPFLSSSFVRDQEIPKLFSHHVEGGMVLYPLLVRPCPWQQVAWLANLQLRPQDSKKRAKAVSAFSGAARDQILADVASEIVKLVKQEPKQPVDDDPVNPSNDIPKRSFSQQDCVGRWSMKVDGDLVEIRLEADGSWVATAPGEGVLSLVWRYKGEWSVKNGFLRITQTQFGTPWMSGPTREGSSTWVAGTIREITDHRIVLQDGMTLTAV